MIHVCAHCVDEETEAQFRGPGQVTKTAGGRESDPRCAGRHSTRGGEEALSTQPPEELELLGHSPGP